MEFDNNDISIPYQQLDVHMVNEKPKKINYAVKDFEIKHIEADEINERAEEDDLGILEENAEEPVEETTEIVEEPEAELIMPKEKVVEPKKEEKVKVEKEPESKEASLDAVEEDDVFVPIKQDVVVGKVVRTKGQQQVSGKIIDRKKEKELKRAEKEAKRLARQQAKLEKKAAKLELEDKE